MTATHRKILQENWTFVTENLANPLDVAEKLYEKRVFTLDMMAAVQAKKTTHRKSRKLLKTLIYRDSDDFDTFCEALIATENETVAEQLNLALQGVCRQGAAGQRGYAIPQPETTLPSDWPNETAMTTPVNVLLCTEKYSSVRDDWLNGDKVYSMKKMKRGRCIIISNKMFSEPLDDKDNPQVQLSNRYGTEKDEERLNQLFTQLRFETVLHTNKTAQKMLLIMKEEARHPDHADAECFVCIVCSHGTETGVYGIDGQVVTLTDLTSCMDGEHCRPLRKKPKLFFIQACQGEKADRPSDQVDAGQDLSQIFDQLNVTDAKKMDSMSACQGARVPTKADLLVACATHPGYVSIRNTQYGSWFIQAVIYVFERYAHKEDITSLLTLVNELVSKGSTSENAGAGSNIKQACHFDCFLTKKLFFFPGLTEDF